MEIRSAINGVHSDCKIWIYSCSEEKNRSYSYKARWDLNNIWISTHDCIDRIFLSYYDNKFQLQLKIT